MELRHLKLVREIARRGSLTKATESLFLSQSALSHQLKAVEEELGAELFHRVNKKLVLTGAGKIFLESAEKVLTELDEAILSVKKYTQGDSGMIRVATECYTCYHWLPAMMSDFTGDFPHVSIEISDEINLNPCEAILAGNLDLGIISYPIDHPHIQSTELFTDEMVAVVPNDHPLVKKKYVYAHDFEDQTLIIHSYPLETSTLYNEILKPEGIRPRKVTAMSITEARIEMIKAGMGISVIPEWIIKPYLRNSNLTSIPVTRKGLWVTWYALFLKQQEVPRYIGNFVDHLRCNVAGICLNRAG